MASLATLTDLPWNHEEALQDALAERSSRVEGPGQKLALVGREVSVPGGRMDLAYVGHDWSVTVVEAKLHRNADYPNVIRQALGYREALLSNPSRAAVDLAEHLRRVAGRRMGGLVRHLTTSFGSTDMPDVAGLEGHLRDAIAAGRVSVVVAADVFDPTLVERARDARAADPSLDLRLRQARRRPDGGLSLAWVDTSDPARHAASFRIPRFAPVEWLPVPTQDLKVEKFAARIPKDNYFERCNGHRVRSYAWPSDVFRCELSPGRAPRNIHQVDPSRTESCAPAMPCMRLLEETGNPYRPEWTRDVCTGEAYRPYVRLSHMVWEALRRDGEITLTAEDGEDRTVQALMRAAGTDKVQRQVEYGPLGVSDTLRDLALWGLASFERRGWLERRFRLLPRAG